MGKPRGRGGPRHGCRRAGGERCCPSERLPARTTLVIGGLAGAGALFLLGLPVLVGTYLDQPCGLRLLCDESDPGTDSRADQCGTSPLHKSVATMGRRATPASGRIAPIETGSVSHGAAEGSHLAAASVRLPQEQHLPFPCEVVARGPETSFGDLFALGRDFWTTPDPVERLRTGAPSTSAGHAPRSRAGPTMASRCVSSRSVT